MLILTVVTGTLRQSPAPWNSTSGMPDMIWNSAFSEIVKCVWVEIGINVVPILRNWKGLLKEKKSENNFCQKNVH